MAQVKTNQLIGYIDCPHCGKEVPLKESKKGFCYYTCDDCGQFFARTRGLDEVLRQKARPMRKEPAKNAEEAMEKDDDEKSGKRKDLWDC